MIKQSTVLNYIGKTVRVLQGDLFEPIGMRRVTKVVFHHSMLPMMTARNQMRILHFDEGRPTGRELLDRAIVQAADHLSVGGEFLLGQFEFLGVQQAFGKPPTTFEVFKRCGFKPKVLATYEIPVTPILKDRATLIQKIYPRYRFTLKRGNLWHKFVIVPAQRR